MGGWRRREGRGLGGEGVGWVVGGRGMWRVLEWNEIGPRGERRHHALHDTASTARTHDIMR